MKKKEHINEQNQNKMEEPGLNYQVNSKFPSTGKKFEEKGKIFEKKRLQKISLTIASRWILSLAI